MKVNEKAGEKNGGELKKCKLQRIFSVSLDKEKKVNHITPNKTKKKH